MVSAAAPSLDGAPMLRWLSIVGIGEDGVAGLNPVARGLIGSAEVVFGERGYLGSVASLIRGVARPWPTPFDGATAEMLNNRGRRICALVSGNPFRHGVGAVLARRIDVREMTIVPAASAFRLAAARLGWALAESVLLPVHDRMLDVLGPHLRPGARILALTSGGDGPRAIAARLSESGFGASRLTVLESVGGPHERVRETTAAEYPFGVVDALNTVGIDVETAPGAREPARTADLADGLMFECDGQIGWREIRALTLSSLAPRRGELLWDIGSGDGAVAVEWLLEGPAMQAIAVERNIDRAARICRNAAAFGVPRLELIEAAAPDALAGLPAPDAILAGGDGDPDLLDPAVCALRPRGRLVVNAATVKAKTAVRVRHAALGGGLTRIALSPGGETVPRPVLQWVWTEP